MNARAKPILEYSDPRILTFLHIEKSPHLIQSFNSTYLWSTPAWRHPFISNVAIAIAIANYHQTVDNSRMMSVTCRMCLTLGRGSPVVWTRQCSVLKKGIAAEHIATESDIGGAGLLG
jgi:hypothetical protein